MCLKILFSLRLKTHTAPTYAKRQRQTAKSTALHHCVQGLPIWRFKAIVSMTRRNLAMIVCLRVWRVAALSTARAANGSGDVTAVFLQRLPFHLR